MVMYAVSSGAIGALLGIDSGGHYGPATGIGVFSFAMGIGLLFGLLLTRYLLKVTVEVYAPTQISITEEGLIADLKPHRRTPGAPRHFVIPWSEVTGIRRENWFDGMVAMGIHQTSPNPPGKGNLPYLVFNVENGKLIEKAWKSWEGYAIPNP
jgi:hypothetical protein